MNAANQILSEAIAKGFKGLNTEEFQASVLYLLSGLAGQKIKSSEILMYSGSGPTADGLVPENPHGVAIAVKAKNTTYIWNPDTKSWDDV